MRRNGRQREPHLDIWPGFVDALSTVLLVFIFVLVGFVSSQVYLSGLIVDKDTSLNDMQTRISTLCSLIDEEKNKNCKLKENNDNMIKQIDDFKRTVSTLQTMFNKEEVVLKEEEARNKTLMEKIEILTQQMKKVAIALDAEKAITEEQNKRIENMQKENIKLNEIGKFNTYRSEFFDNLKNIIKDKSGIKIVGDRFIFQSELFFDTASDTLSEDGKSQISDLAKVIKDIGSKIPRNIKWILRVDGHTDSRPISGKFASNWELSASRAISVVKNLISHGVGAEHLVAAGFGEHQPILNNKSEEALAKNRRIEFKLDQR